MGIKTVESIAPKVGSMSCVGIAPREFPLSFGNYFWFTNEYRAVNFWAENLNDPEPWWRWWPWRKRPGKWEVSKQTMHIIIEAGSKE